MTPKIRMSPAATLTPTGSGVILNSDLGTFRLQGKDVSVFVEAMLPLLNGEFSREEIAERIEQHSDASILKLLSMLDERGILEPAPAPDAKVDFGPQERLARILDNNFLERLNTSSIAVIGLEPWGVTSAVELAATGVGAITVLDDRNVTNEDLVSVRYWTPNDIGQPRSEVLKNTISRIAPNCNVTICALDLDKDGELKLDEEELDLIITSVNADDHLLLKAVSRITQATKTPSLHGHLNGQEAWVGPAIIPGTSGCWNCFRLRTLATSDNKMGAHEVANTLLKERQSPRARALLAPMAPVVGHMMAMDALRLLGLDESHQLAGSYRVADLLSGQTTIHRYIPMPWCEVCGGAQAMERPPEPDRANGFVLDQIPDSETLRTLMGGWIDKRSGVVSSLMESPTHTTPSLPRTASATLAGYTTGNIHGASSPMLGSGKAVTGLAAEIGALGEAIERYSASRFDTSSMLYAAYNELEGDAVNPAKMALYSRRHYTFEGFPCTPFDPSKKMHWVKGHWIAGDGPVWVPALPTFFNFNAPKSERFCMVSSNGLAAGGDIKDATARATFELLERDQFMLTWLCRLPTRRLEIDTALSPELTRVTEQIKAHGAEIEFRVLDDLGTGIHTVVCLSFGDGKRWGGTSLGLSCHPNMRTAMSKALLEQAHFGPYLARLMQTETIPEKPENVITLEEHALYYAPPERQKAFDFMRDNSEPPVLYSSLSNDEPDDLYEYLAKGLDNVGLKVAAVDVTSPDVRLSPFRVARALGEGIQPIHFGYANRPLENARLKKILGSRPINPDPHPIA